MHISIKHFRRRWELSQNNFGFLVANSIVNVYTNESWNILDARRNYWITDACQSIRWKLKVIWM